MLSSRITTSLPDLGVPRGRLVESRGDHFRAGAVPLERGHFFGAFVDQQDDHVSVGVIDVDGVGNLLQQNRLAGSRWGDHEHPLAEADRGDHVHHPHGDFLGGGFQNDPLVGVRGGQVLEADAVLDLVGLFEIDGLDAEQREVLLGLLGRPNLPGDDVPLLQAETPNLTGRDVDVVGAGQVVVVGASQEAESVRQDFQHALAVHQAVALNPRTDQPEHQLLSPQRGDVVDALFLGQFVEVGDLHLLEVFDVQVAALDLLVLGVHFLVEAGDGLVGLLGGGSFFGRSFFGRSFLSRSVLDGRVGVFDGRFLDGLDVYGIVGAGGVKDFGEVFFGGRQGCRGLLGRGLDGRFGLLAGSLLLLSHSPGGSPSNACTDIGTLSPEAVGPGQMVFSRFLVLVGVLVV
jgi:hypothetical protein